MASWTQAQSAPAAPSGRIIDRVVAVIAGRALSLSELEFEGRVALIQAGGVEAATAPLGDEALRGALEHAIFVRLQIAEADKLRAYPNEPGEVEAALAAFQRRFAAPGELQRFLDRHDADRQQLAAVLGRTLRATKALEAKLRLRAQVSEAEVRRYYDENAAQLGADYEAVRAPLRQKLSSARLRERTVAEMAQLRKGAEVRLIAPFARVQEASSP